MECLREWLWVGANPDQAWARRDPLAGTHTTPRDTHGDTHRAKLCKLQKERRSEKSPQTHRHSRTDSQAEIQPGSSGKREGERAAERGEARYSERRGRSGERGSDRHIDRRDSDTAHGKGINTDPHVRARPGFSTWKMLGVRGQWMNSWEGKWV